MRAREETLEKIVTIINSPVVPNGWCYDDFVCSSCEVFLTRPPLYYSLNVDFILKRSFLL